MKNKSWNIALCWISAGTIFFTFGVLPELTTRMYNLSLSDRNIVIQLFYSILLSHPFIRAAQYYGDKDKFRKINPPSLAEHKKENKAWGYYINAGMYFLTNILFMYLALRNIFSYLSIFHYLSILLYGTSAAFLDYSIINER